MIYQEIDEVNKADFEEGILYMLMGWFMTWHSMNSAITTGEFSKSFFIILFAG